MKLNAAHASLVLVFPVLLFNLWGCNLDENESSAEPSVTPTTIQPSVTPTAPNVQALLAFNNAAEAYYQELLARYGENYQECVEQVELKLDELAKANVVNVTKSIPGEEQPLVKHLNVIFVLDASGSMAGRVSSDTKLDVAKRAIALFASQLPQSTKVGLAVFGHKGSNAAADQAVSCAGIESIYGLSQLDNQQFSQAINSFQASGYTPLAATLEHLNQALSTYDSATNYNVVYVVSDGNDNCDGDPVLAAIKLHDSNAKVIINVIGFDVDSAAQQQLQSVAEAGGGKYFRAKNAVELNQIFEYARQISSEYTAVNLVDQNRFTVLSVETNRLLACITVKMNREFAQIMSQANNLTAIQASNNQYNQYILTRLRDRQDKIVAERDQLQTELQNQQDLTIDKLKQNLAKASQEIEVNTGQAPFGAQ